MSAQKIIKRELEVAFSRKAQPIWMRILKYVLLGAVVYFFWESSLFWIILTVLFIGALATHFWVRYKTRGWTQSYGLWNYDKHKPDTDNNLEEEK
jgi:hypothetical protein